jgi:hypothetical protein
MDKISGFKAVVQICKTSRVNPEILATAQLSGMLCKISPLGNRPIPW